MTRSSLRLLHTLEEEAMVVCIEEPDMLEDKQLALVPKQQHTLEGQTCPICMALRVTPAVCLNPHVGEYVWHD